MRGKNNKYVIQFIVLFYPTLWEAEEKMGAFTEKHESTLSNVAFSLAQVKQIINQCIIYKFLKEIKYIWIVIFPIDVF